MFAIEITEAGGPEVLRWNEVPDPTAGAGEVLIKVAATAVNRADVMQRRGLYPPPPGASDIPGLECSGVIAAVGDPNPGGWKVGDRVCALLAGGGYAEYVAVPAGQVLPIPDGLGFIEAAGLVEVAATVWSNLVTVAGLTAGQTVLIHGGAGGIGTMAIQVAAALGATVAVTAGSARGLELCEQLGARILVNYREEDFVERIAQETSGRGVEVILDVMGAKYLSRNISALADGGHLVVIGMQGGVKAELDLGSLMAKRASVTATALRSRPVEGPGSKSEIISQLREHLWDKVAAGEVLPIVGAQIPLADAADGHRLMESGDAPGGKIVLTADASARMEP